MLQWVGSKGNLRAPDRQRLFFPDNIELGRKGDSLNIVDFQPQRRTLSSGKTDVIIRITKAYFCFYYFLLLLLGWESMLTEIDDDIAYITSYSWLKWTVGSWFSGLWCLIAIKHLPFLEYALPFLYINMSGKCHVWEQGYQSPGKQHQNQGRQTTEGAQNRDLDRPASVNCETYTLVLELRSSLWADRVQPL